MYRVRTRNARRKISANPYYSNDVDTAADHPMENYDDFYLTRKCL